MTEAIWWEIFYKAGSKYDWMIVYAHDKDQAREVAALQIRCTQGSSKVQVLEVRKKKFKTLDNYKKV